MKLKKVVLAVVFGGVISQANANYPVFDMTNYMAAMKEFQEMQRQYDQAVQRYNTLRAQYDALVAVQNSIKHGVSLGELYDVSTMYSSYLGKLTSYTEDYFNDVTSISPQAKKLASHLMTADGHEQDLSDVPSSLRKSTQNVYYLEGEEMWCVDLQKKAINQYMKTLNTRRIELLASNDMKVSQDILNAMEYDKKAYEFNKEMLTDYMKLLKEQREANQRQIQLSQRKFLFGNPEKQEKK